MPNLNTSKLSDFIAWSVGLWGCKSRVFRDNLTFTNPLYPTTNENVSGYNQHGHGLRHRPTRKQIRPRRPGKHCTSPSHSCTSSSRTAQSKRSVCSRSLTFTLRYRPRTIQLRLLITRPRIHLIRRIL
jgi:hypothetical protein